MGEGVGEINIIILYFPVVSDFSWGWELVVSLFEGIVFFLNRASLILFSVSTNIMMISITNMMDIIKIMNLP